MTNVLKNMLDLALLLVPTLGKEALSAVERSVTLPEKDIRKTMGDADEAKKAKAVSLWRKAADALSDALVYTASKGQIDPD